MLEQGAQFGTVEGDAAALTPDIENQFLRNIMEFEKQIAEHKTIKVFDKIGRPAQFKPAREIPIAQIDAAWNELDSFLKSHKIELSVCSPNVSNAELYRFTVEELFEYGMDDLDIPGMKHCFTYDEFHPDNEFENTTAAVEGCIKRLLAKEPLDWMAHYRSNGLRLNEHFPLTAEEFKNRVNLFHDAYDEIKLKAINDHYCAIDDKSCTVKGTYTIVGKLDFRKIELEGNWLVEFDRDETPEDWYIINVQVGGINF